MRTKALQAESKEPMERAQALQQPAVSMPQPIGVAATLLSLQRSHGNQFVQRLLRSRRMQAKLTISEPGDQYEQEADRVAETVMRMPEPIASEGAAVAGQVTEIHTQPPGAADAEHLHRQTMEEEMEEEDEGTLQAKEVAGETPEVTPELEARLNSARGRGQPLPESVRAFFEPRFGYDFGGVRVHTDGQAVDSARSVKAHAYTLGQDIVFGSGQYAPETPSGKQLLAHELTHVVQADRGYGTAGHKLAGPLAPSAPLRPSQSGILERKCACGGAAGLSGECENCGKRLDMQTKLKVSEPGDIYEQEADRVAAEVLAATADSAIGGAPPRIQRFSEQPTGHADAAPASVDHALASPGRPLDPALRQDMEQRFGHDFSAVRVHADSSADAAASAVGARAFSVGRHIVFAAAQYAPQTSAGQHLLAHELTHVVQQQLLGSRTPPALQRKTPIKVEPRTIPTQGEIDKRAEPVKREMKEALKTWKEESRWGVQNFVNAELEAKIDEVRSSGVTASSFLLSLAGNIVWAAACFTTGGAAFTISLVGIAIAASGSLPGDKGLSDKGAIAAMAKEVQQYLDQCETWLKADVDRRAHNLVLFNQDKDQVELLELFMMNSFKPDVLAKGPEGRLTQLNPGAVREAQQRALTERWQHFKETVPLAGKEAGSEATAGGIAPKGGRLRLILVQGKGIPFTKHQWPPRWGLGLELWPNKFGIAKWVPNDVLSDVDRRIQEVAGKKLPPLVAEPTQIVVYPDEFWQYVEGIWVAP